MADRGSFQGNAYLGDGPDRLMVVHGVFSVLRVVEEEGFASARQRPANPRHCMILKDPQIHHAASFHDPACCLLGRSC